MRSSFAGITLAIAIAISSAACDSGEPRASEPAKSSAPTEVTPPPNAQASTKVEPPRQPAAEPTPVEQPRPPADSSSTAVEPSSGPGPMRFEPMVAGEGKLPHDIPDDMCCYLQKFGWTADGKTFIACGESMGDEDGGPCSVAVLGQAVKTLQPNSPGYKKVDRTPVEKGPTHWRYGNEITFTWSASVGEDAVSLQLGGKLASGKGKPDVLTWSFDPEVFWEAQVFPEVASVSPDGEQLAVVGHASFGEIDAAWTVQTIDVDEFALQVYTRVAFDHLDKGEYAEAEPMFARAAEIDQHWKHPYNLACARARGGSKDVEAALRMAIERGGETVKKKARTDKDLDSVRAEAWFTKLVGR